MSERSRSVAVRRQGLGAQLEDAPCRCGDVGCGGMIRPEGRTGYALPRLQRRRLKRKVCDACRMRHCLAHYGLDGVNIPARDCPARTKYQAARAVKTA